MLHYSSLAIMDRVEFDDQYDMDGRFQGGLQGIMGVAKVIAITSAEHRSGDKMDEDDDEN